MDKVAIGFLTKDRVELTKRSIESLQHPDIDLWWFDGSNTQEGENLLADYPAHKKFANVKGGADAAIVCALSAMLAAAADYRYIGLCENDVLLHQDWFVPTMQLFVRGVDDGLRVGAVSPRAYEDRVLFQCDGYAVMHNLGAGVVVFSRAAVITILTSYRTGWTSENRIVFAQLAGIDIGRYWAFRASENFLTADWGFDRVLAVHGFASLALTPSPVEMIGQVPALADQGLTLVEQPVELLRDNRRLEAFKVLLAAAWDVEKFLTVSMPYLRDPDGGQLFFTHQLHLLDAKFSDGWRLQWSQSFGPFAYRAETSATMTLSAFGGCEVLVSGGKSGAKVRLRDAESGYEVTPLLTAEDGSRVPQLVVPGFFSQRDIVLDVEPGAVLYGFRSSWPQIINFGNHRGFDFAMLPPV